MSKAKRNPIKSRGEIFEQGEEKSYEKAEEKYLSKAKRNPIKRQRRNI